MSEEQSPVPTHSDLYAEAHHKVYPTDPVGKDNMHALLIAMRDGDSDPATVARAWAYGTSHPIRSGNGATVPGLAAEIEALFRNRVAALPSASAKRSRA